MIMTSIVLNTSTLCVLILINYKVKYSNDIQELPDDYFNHQKDISVKDISVKDISVEDIPAKELIKDVSKMSVETTGHWTLVHSKLKDVSLQILR